MLGGVVQLPEDAPDFCHSELYKVVPGITSWRSRCGEPQGQGRLQGKGQEGKGPAPPNGEGKGEATTAAPESPLTAWEVLYVLGNAG